MDERVLITNIQRFSLHDGPGIRTTVFCKGCSLHCPWCSNPENIKTWAEQYQKDGYRGVYGRYISCDELFKEIMKDKLFYVWQDDKNGLNRLPGGVTFSGGEPLLQAEQLKPLLKRLKADEVHICVETCLFVPRNRLGLVLEYVDLFYIDIKILNSDSCREILGGRLKKFYHNLEFLAQNRNFVVFRVPVIGGYTDSEENCNAVIELIQQYRPMKVELLKEHNLGQSKYWSLGKKPLKLGTITDVFMDEYARKIESKAQVQTEICMV